MKSEGHSRAFSVIAPYYDKLMSFVDYPSWVSYIETILSLNNVTKKSILDLACGTGVCLKLWLDRGYEVIGVDRSLSMLNVCKEKLLPGLRFLLINADMRDLTLTRKIPIITCLYDSLNYLLTETDIVDCFTSVYNTLTENGLFIFDMNTTHALRDEWGNQTFYRQDQEVSSIWINRFDPETNTSTLDLTLKVRKDGGVREFKEIHEERAYPLTKIHDLLSRIGFNVSFYRHLTFSIAEEGDLRIMGIARK